MAEDMIEARVPLNWFGCRAGRDGECSAADCPQLRDGEPARSGRHCPRDVYCGDPCCDAAQRANAALKTLAQGEQR